MVLQDSVQHWLQHSATGQRLRRAYHRAVGETELRHDGQTRLNLALQGGGVLGAFTWGVLDRLSREPALRIDAISGASAGAVNAALFASGYVTEGAEGARRRLDAFWSEIADASALAKFVFFPALSPAQARWWRRAFHPSSAFDFNPLRSALETHVDFDALRAPEAPALFISATHVPTAKARLFTNQELTLDVLLASACLPNLHPTVLIDGEPYWDGGFTANPALSPLTDRPADRTLLVRLMASGAEKLPQGNEEIDAYMKNLMFDRPLEEELARLAETKKLTALDVVFAGDYEPDAQITTPPSPALIRSLFEKGKTAGEDYFARLKDDPAETPDPQLARRTQLSPDSS
ncbi:patatin-like phospholipase family protein [Hyphococcus sp.]|uniref:patatin-like phospholipase family protein n=1 Tax=Hyphococcus sp. TaxID=2038636 RepID=UPI003D107AD3